MAAADKKNKKGQTKPFQKKQNEKPNRNVDTKVKNNKPNFNDDKLREAVLALGGTMKPDAIKNELKAFMQNIGLTSDKYEQDVDTEDEEVQEEVQEEEEEEEEEEEAIEEDAESEEAIEEAESEEEEKEEKEQMKIHPTKLTSSKNVLVEPTPFWYNVELPKVSIENVKRLSPTETAERYSYAKELLAEENTKAETHPLLTSSNRSFMSNIITSGTLNDKVSALTLMFRESPLHGIKTLDTLMNMGRKKGRNEAVMAVTSVKDLFIGSVLPDRKLIYFADRPLAS